MIKEGYYFAAEYVIEAILLLITYILLMFVIRKHFKDKIQDDV